MKKAKARMRYAVKINGIGEKIRAQLKYMNISREDLAEKIGANRKTIDRWITERETPNKKSIEAMAEVFGCSIEYMLGYYD